MGWPERPSRACFGILEAMGKVTTFSNSPTDGVTAASRLRGDVGMKTQLFYFQSQVNEIFRVCL